ncbi:MAG: ABC transporter permease [Acidimicrobiales bacterium]
MLIIALALAGLGIGAVAGLSGLGLLVTYRVTGVFNLAFGAIAMFSAYLVWFLVRSWHWPVGLAGLLVVLGIGPAMGVLLDLLVFRTLRRRGAAPAELLAATLGVLVLLLGVAYAVWGGQARTDVPSLVPQRSFELTNGIYIRAETIVDVLAVVLVGAGLVLVQRTRVGRTVRAVVESRVLAELAGIDSDTVSAIGWAVGSSLAALSGMLLAPALSSLDPIGLTLVVLETMAVVVIAGASHPGRAVVAALVIGIGQAELTQFHPGGLGGQLMDALTTNLFVVVLFLALLAMKRLDEPGGDGDTGTTARLAVRRELSTPRGWWIPALVLLCVPFVASTENLRTAQQVPALAVILVSIVVLSGYGGQISLGQAGFAGLGALLTAKLAQGELGPFPAVNGLIAIPLGAMLVVPVGLLTSWLAIRRRGLFLALTTFAVGAVVSRFVFAQPSFVTGVHIGPPPLFRSDDSFYTFELLGLGGALILVRNLHRGRLGRALVAVRDDEAGARASGIDVPRLKLVMFAASALLAGFGGTLLAASSRAFDATAFDPIRGLLWFATVVVFGVDSAAGAVMGAAALVALDAAFGEGISTLAIGIVAIMLGRLPGGLVYSVRRGVRTFTARFEDDGPPPRVRLSPAGAVVAKRLKQC